MARKHKEPKNYVNNANLLKEILKSQENLKQFPEEEQQDRVMEALTPELVEMIMQMVKRISVGYGWRGYSWNDDIQLEAIMNLSRVALKFNLEKAGDKPNPFAYYTQIIKRVFISYIDKQKKQGKIKDGIIMMSDTTMVPSYSEKYEAERNSLHVDLDGTKNVKSDPRKYKRRKKRGKRPPEDETDKMTDREYQEWLDNKCKEYLDKGGEIH